MRGNALLAHQTADLSRSFRDNGFVVLRGVLDANGVAEVRDLISRRTAPASSGEMLASEVLAHPELAGIVLDERVVSAVRELIGGEVALYPNFTARKNVYVSWHVDDAFCGSDREYVWRPEFTHVQCGLYLQDNSASLGGGVDVIRGSHLMSFDGYGKLPPRFDTVEWTLGAGPLREMVDTKAGDMLIWHARLMHTSTPAREKASYEKLGVFFSYGRDDLEDNNTFLSRLAMSRVRTMNGITGPIPRLMEVVGMRYPDSFPAWFAERAAKAGIRIATL